MRARAPGKVVISGAYAVLEGARALVSAVGRYALADTGRPATFVTDEVRASRLSPVPWFDANELRSDSRKLGLGSSAAILVASLAAHELENDSALDAEALATRVFARALDAHRLAQPRGSGIDVCSSCFGGHRLITRHAATLHHEAVTLPDGLHLQVWAAPSSCSTHSMLEALREFRQRGQAEYNRRLAAQYEASERAAAALIESRPAAFIRALDEQCHALEALGRDAGVPIVTDSVATLAKAAASEAAAVLPAGAGGGDVAIYAGLHAPSEQLNRLASALNHEMLPMDLGVLGVHSVPSEC